MENNNKCSSENCEKDATMLCPTCVKQSLPAAYFCSQECFKKSWASHKSKHKVETKWLEVDPAFSGFKFTGPLRPGKLSTKRAVPSTIARPDYADMYGGTSAKEDKDRGLLRVYTKEEIEIMRETCRLGAEVLAIAGKMAKPGVTTDEIDRVVHEACLERGCYPSPLNYRAFPKSVCTSVNEVICHGIPDNRELQDGDIMNCDVSVYHNGFHGDLNETWLIGDNVTEQDKKHVQTTYECLELAIAACKPGMLYRDIGQIIERHAKKNSLSVVRTYCGHGVGELFHCNPNVPHYGRNKAVGVMKAGHIFTIEPMINQGDWADKLWPDDWTAVTHDGKKSAQFEHTLVITDTGCEVLTKRLAGTYIDRF
jgi:methionyl aminopeptidase